MEKTGDIREVEEKGWKKKSINEKQLSEEEPCSGTAIAGLEKKKEKKES